MKKTIMMGVAVLAVLGMAIAGVVGTGDDGSLDGASDHGHKLTIFPNGPDDVWNWVSPEAALYLPECPYAWEGHDFLYYSGNDLGLGQKFMPGDYFEPDGWMTLYCIWDKTISPTNNDSGNTYNDNSDPNSSLYAIAIGAIAIVVIFALVLIIRR